MVPIVTVDNNKGVYSRERWWHRGCWVLFSTGGCSIRSDFGCWGLMREETSNFLLQNRIFPMTWLLQETNINM
ncbi:hypothetical protein XELAEV_18030240mg [Xenopus laevis]|uniref:Uncharacterized protein n=1 Tax=Xenopus laevis TaxID=8355 RepID=A0A974HIC1_XENLA|nr:hypothetical protein XELAEV_18030240mg [Xenopus laevis]